MPNHIGFFPGMRYKMYRFGAFFSSIYLSLSSYLSLIQKYKVHVVLHSFLKSTFLKYF